MARTDQWNDERTEVITTHQTDHDQAYRQDGTGSDRDPHDAEQDGHDPDRTQVVTGIATPDRDEPVHYQPVEQPTAFGAATVGGAVAASAMAGPERLHEQRDPRDDDTVRVGDGPVPDETAIGRADQDDTVVVPTDTETDPTDPDEVTALPTDMPADTSAETTGGAAFFADDEATAFRDRWRDVQLRFVDDPHAAAGEAQGLVTEAVEALTAALTAQRDELSGWTSAGPEDTEQLRMAVRRYRDLLDRVLAI
ncbi:hypothetical protein [Micromonospora sp. NBC_01813]|uniref:hypothetical protein n=1 Tax=Micromonospora sp. NBC_01813 TaxID=2975988 RepID=UPI002DD7F1DD|nr:hypothetical protein [Micromonospora sp. NBC_01813]WSA12008.1 hypothetical protein OG958_15200 [Micromonospora sp. NBC_01813]